METSNDKRVLIIADAHLPLDDRPGGAEQRKAFLELIRHHRGQLGTLVLLGDVFDFWYEWKHVVPKRAFAILSELRQIVDSGVPVHYFAGNHDFRIHDFLSNDIGLILHMDEWQVELDGRKYWFHHGDGLAKSDVNYRRMKSLFRNRVAQFLFGVLVHPDFAMGLGRTTSDGGRKKTELRREIWPPEPEYIEAAKRILAKTGRDIVVIGHTHIANTVKLDNGFYHNPGPFYQERRYSFIAGELPQSEVWR